MKNIFLRKLVKGDFNNHDGAYNLVKFNIFVKYILLCYFFGYFYQEMSVIIMQKYTCNIVCI